MCAAAGTNQTQGNVLAAVQRAEKTSGPNLLPCRSRGRSSVRVNREKLQAVSHTPHRLHIAVPLTQNVRETPKDHAYVVQSELRSNNLQVWTPGSSRDDQVVGYPSKPKTYVDIVLSPESHVSEIESLLRSVVLQMVQARRRLPPMQWKEPQYKKKPKSGSDVLS